MGLRLASFVTLSLMVGMVFALFGALAFLAGAVDLYVLIAGVVVINFLIWLLSPRISDISYSWFYDFEWITLEELRDLSPESAEVIEKVTEDYGYSNPKLGLIHDSNPQAFTYGSGRWNSRIIVTSGLFEYLDSNEASSVYAHELGHVTNRDFILMTMANTAVQVLYLLYIGFRREALRGNNKKSSAFLLSFALVSLAFYYIGKYLVYYLSRVREYYADRFAAEYTDPNYLSSALIKISYGIMDSPDNDDLMKTTEAMGIMNLEQGREKGELYYKASNLESWDPLAKSFLFDLKNPWASLLELKSTHPLTGKRIRALTDRSENPMFDFDRLLNRFKVDRRRLWTNFLKDLTVVGTPKLLYIAILIGYLVTVATGSTVVGPVGLVGLLFVAMGLARAVRILYSYPLKGEPEEKTVLELLSDVYASPVRGKKAMIEGEVIGRGRAGHIFGSDLKFEDDTGILHLTYRSLIPGIGEWLFGWRTAEKYVDSDVKVKGWYRRGLSPSLMMSRITSTDIENGSYPHRGLILAVLLIAIGATFLALGTISPL